MSTDELKLIPTDPQWLPAREDADNAAGFLKTLYPSADVDMRFLDEVSFVDQGENFEDVRCQGCGTVLETTWWQERMNEAYRTAFVDRSVHTPCCGIDTTLNDLDYRWPAGFARFVLWAEDWGSDERDQLNAAELTRLGELLGNDVRQILARY